MTVTQLYLEVVKNVTMLEDKEYREGLTPEEQVELATYRNAILETLDKIKGGN